MCNVADRAGKKGKFYDRENGGSKFIVNLNNIRRRNLIEFLVIFYNFLSSLYKGSMLSLLFQTCSDLNQIHVNYAVATESHT